MTRSVTVGQFLERSGSSLQLEDLGQGRGFDRMIPGEEISSPGLALAGYVERFVGERLQVLGETEVTYLASLDAEQREQILTQFFSFPLPAVIITKGQDPPAGLCEAAARSGVALLRTRLKTSEPEFLPGRSLDDEIAAYELRVAALAATPPEPLPPIIVAATPPPMAPVMQQAPQPRVSAAVVPPSSPAPLAAAAPGTCRSCGLSISANARFCRRCGTSQVA